MMGNHSYMQALRDHQYLWNIGPAYDMTGGYTDQEDLELLLKSPTKTTARKCLVRQIVYWFQVGPELDADVGFMGGKCAGSEGANPERYIGNDPAVAEIYERYIL